MTRQAAARAKGIELAAFSTPQQFYNGVVPMDATGYVDAELRAKGYFDVWLETGHPQENFAHIAGLKVQGKEPPWE